MKLCRCLAMLMCFVLGGIKASICCPKNIAARSAKTSRSHRSASVRSDSNPVVKITKDAFTT
eukprot:CAMPEP_0194772788 /NCGR_PEP_ID=MMETSP0323_2-20130528/52996_1 /TAXON_ID=2866 ORGANISM="Crypthecodinium cohnii, Strain Seligo" /NCGR_SAMPLE_ID=MMETSP0323_2 /ASSEMBLY_ACC=CAM_ASM_000346 /LENGTH=61 /DNA_ID=CAMNT_0039707499 /DNA_START=45 /DNA_END=227 /DNA_ORIENTATION=-